MIVVADSSPLIYLSRVGVLDVLASAFGSVIVPARVWEELVDARPEAPGVDSLRAARWLNVDARALGQIDLGLDPGETAAILLAEEIHADGRTKAGRPAPRRKRPTPRLQPAGVAQSAGGPLG